MAKVNKKYGKPGQQGKNAVKRRQHSQVLPQKVKTKQKQSSDPKSGTSGSVQANQRPKIPFMKNDRVLLVGEGDFSFALSLVQNHRIQALTATCYDSEAELVEKYPTVKQTIDKLLALGNRAPADPASSQVESSFEGFSPASTPPTTAHNPSPTSQTIRRGQIQVFYGIDATRLSSTHSKLLRPSGPFTKIVFNFPHTGGLSTDVNRQVRANQQLLVSFFETAKHLLLSSLHALKTINLSNKPAERYSTPSDDDDDDDNNNDANSHDNISGTDPSPSAPPQLLTTLFTTPPYTLWNIRDLARHTGYSVTTSFRFPWESYPGYTHARTLGEITHGKDRSGEGKRKGAWRGEEREARTYVLELKEGEGPGAAAGGGGGAGNGRAERGRVEGNGKGARREQAAGGGQRKRKWKDEGSDSD
jgi:25S rRNA (uracil2634-N3)-methyltransferase